MAEDTVELQSPSDFLTLQTDFLAIIDRGGDSSMGNSLAGKYLNAAEQLICSRIGAPHFLEYSDTITCTANSPDLTFPVNVKDVTMMFDKANMGQLTFIDAQKWNAYIVDPTNSTGEPVSWTKWGYSRRTNAESPSQPYGAMKAKVWPTPTSATVLDYDCVLRPGFMISDSDHPVVPSEWHFALIQVAIMIAGPRDVGVRTFQEYSRMAEIWLREIVRSERRDLSGNIRFTPREEHIAKSRRKATPLTRMNQLYGGHG